MPFRVRSAGLSADVASYEGRVNVEIHALDASIRSTIVWIDPDKLESVATISMNPALHLEASRLKLLAASKSAARVAQEENFGANWVEFFNDWNNVDSLIKQDIGSDDEAMQALSVYEGHYEAWRDEFAKLTATPYSHVSKVTLPPAPPETKIEEKSPAAVAKKAQTSKTLATVAVLGLGAFVAYKIFGK